MGSRLEDRLPQSPSTSASPAGGRSVCDDDDGDDFVIATTKEFCHGQQSRATRSAATAASAAAPWEPDDECCHDDLTLLAQLEPNLAACFSLRLRNIEEQSRELRCHAEQLRGAVKHAETLKQYQATRLRESRPRTAPLLLGLQLGLQVFLLLMAGLVLVWTLGLARTSLGMFDNNDNLCQHHTLDEAQQQQPPHPTTLTRTQTPAPAAIVELAEPRPIYGSEECVHRVLQAHAEAQEIEAFMERDILGFQQMLSAMSEWISVASSRLDQETEQAVGMPCCTSATQAVYQGAMDNIRATLLSSNTIASDLRRDLRVERQRVLAATSR
mmetsp:Transcript_65639/g.137199  ORF Transcript_65639/g.137199 Transcript_65639/m.137199 type:complete len:327 (+) Transcript_65639:61-1041(+)|eukprot:CAMPEP_0206459850 /NCGR_PEP_ID=MMETSP0324_2-20121206/24417_1 /ASSEMBLY_ACC=CAM_ASM_000836 /TAXON_ID=2866 /ORGANISM="Crypthecodinium cohnii, Strain Seligo" /LENGTH=326 /DNA_ID=CAMNT_0053931471 /DNA_START=40 /DNA_END=1020 /DNA_ORIENTATION=-